MSRKASEIKCNENDINSLNSVVNNGLSSPRMVMKARTILMCLDGMENKEIAAALSTREGTVGKWRKDFSARGIDFLKDQPRPGKRGRNAPDTRQSVIDKLSETPPDGLEQWNTEALSKAVGTSVDTVRRALNDHDISLAGRKRYSVETNAVSMPAVADIAGLYLSADAKAVVLCMNPEGETEPFSGVFTTRSISAARTVQSKQDETGLVSLEAALTALAESPSVMESRSAPTGVLDFLNQMTGSLRFDTRIQYHVILHLENADAVQPGLTYPNISITSAASTESWLQLTDSWLKPLCPHTYALLSAIRMYLSVVDQTMLPFIWRRNDIKWSEELLHASGTANSQDRASLLESSFEDPAVDTVMLVEAVIRTRDGEEVRRSILKTNPVPSMDGIRMDLIDQYAVDSAKVGDGIQSATSMLASGLYEDYMSAAV